MRSALRPKVMTLYRTRITFADRCPLNIHFLTARKYIRKRQNGPCGIFTRHRLINAKFTNNLSSLHSCFREVTRLRLGNTRGTTRTERHLNSDISVIFLGFNLGHTIVRHIHHRDGNRFAVIGKKTRHANLAPKQSQTIALTHL